MYLRVSFLGPGVNLQCALRVVSPVPASACQCRALRRPVAQGVSVLRVSSFLALPGPPRWQSCPAARAGPRRLRPASRPCQRHRAGCPGERGLRMAAGPARCPRGTTARVDVTGEKARQAPARRGNVAGLARRCMRQAAPGGRPAPRSPSGLPGGHFWRGRPTAGLHGARKGDGLRSGQTVQPGPRTCRHSTLSANPPADLVSA
jgi:hypothetical protein